MLNEEKVKNMTKSAAYEKGPEKENIEINHYFREDYLSLQLIKSAFAYTVSFCLLVVIWGMMGTEQLMLQLTHADYLQKLLKILLVLFVAGLVVYELLVYFHYSRKYRLTKESIDGYQTYLKNINKFYETEESAEDELIEVDLADGENIL